MKFSRLLLLPAVAAALALAGCAGSGSSIGAPPANSFVLNSNVLELDKAGGTVTSVTPDTVVVTGAPTIAPGQIIIHNALDDKRFVRKVVTATKTGSTTTIKTSDAGVEDVFKTAQITQQ